MWACGRGQTDTQTNRQTDRQTHTYTQTSVTTIHFASSRTHAKCNNDIQYVLQRTQKIVENSRLSLAFCVHQLFSFMILLTYGIQRRWFCNRRTRNVTVVMITYKSVDDYDGLRQAYEAIARHTWRMSLSRNKWLTVPLRCTKTSNFWTNNRYFFLF